jgi:gliding motility-associated-like protein
MTATVAQDFTIFTIAKYFTPNNDGFNDLWKIKEMEYPNSTAQIFNRYGKLIINLNSSNISGMANTAKQDYQQMIIGTV